MLVKAHITRRVRKQTEMERRKSVVRIFINMFAGSIKRYQIWNVVPWDPGAWSGPRTTFFACFAHMQCHDLAACSRSAWIHGTVLM